MARQMPSAKSLENLKKSKKTIRTAEQARVLGRIGGIKSGQARKEKKLLSQIYAEFLIENHKVKLGRKEIDLPADEIIKISIARNLMATGTSASVAVLKEIADRTEGTSGAGAEGSKKDVDLLGSLLGSPNETKTTEGTE